MRTMKNFFLVIGILIKLLIDLAFGLTVVTLMTLAGFVVAFTAERLALAYFEIKEHIS